MNAKGQQKGNLWGVLSIIYPVCAGAHKTLSLCKNSQNYSVTRKSEFYNI